MHVIQLYWSWKVEIKNETYNETFEWIVKKTYRECWSGCGFPNSLCVKWTFQLFALDGMDGMPIMHPILITRVIISLINMTRSFHVSPAISAGMLTCVQYNSDFQTVNNVQFRCEVVLCWYVCPTLCSVVNKISGILEFVLNINNKLQNFVFLNRLKVS